MASNTQATNDFCPGRILIGEASALAASREQWAAMPVDLALPAPQDWQPGRHQTTLAGPFQVTGPATYSRRAQSTLRFAPCERPGWWIDRADLPEQLPIQVSVRNVWTSSRSIVLRSGSPHNYLRMVEHIIALKLGLGLDNALIHIGTGDPPLFDAGSMPLVEGVDQAGIREQQPLRPLVYWTVKEPVTVVGPGGSFLHLAPAERGERRLSLDVAVDFPTAIGRQRLQFDLCPAAFRHGAQARTNCSLTEVIFAKTVGKLFADVRSLGYTRENILIAGRHRYLNRPRLLENGRSLEAVWHRAVLDLVAALSLIDTGRLAGRIVSYKAGHTLDVRLVTQLLLHGLLEPLD
jgi:UDP-3-O-acyl-N-acetylglucosamine deacetylase